MKKRSLFPILLIGFTLGLTSCNEDSKKEDITTNPFANLPADSGQKPTTEQMDAAPILSIMSQYRLMPN